MYKHTFSYLFEITKNNLESISDEEKRFSNHLIIFVKLKFYSYLKTIRERTHLAEGERRESMIIRENWEQVQNFKK